MLKRAHQPAPTPRTRAHRVALWALLVAGAAIRLAVRSGPYSHPDEPITTGVVNHMLNRHTLDTNWAHARVPEPFKYDQYNFSGWHVFAAGPAWFARLVGYDNTLQATRALSLVLSVGVVYLTYLLGRSWYSEMAGLLGAAFAASAPLLVQDSLYARPESFLTLLTCCLFLAATQRDVTLRLVVIASALFGFAVATKVSMLIVAPVVAGVALRSAGPRSRWRPKILLLPVGAAVVAAAAGFVAGAPKAIFDPSGFRHGIEVLSDQYSGVFWPHGTEESGVPPRLTYGLSYFGNSAGYLLVVLLVLGLAWFLTTPDRVFLVAMSTTLTAAYFMTTPTFFERNLSHIAPTACVFCAVGLLEVVRRCRNARARAVLAWGLTATALLQPVLTDRQIVRAVDGTFRDRTDRMRASLVMEYQARDIQLGWSPEVPVEVLSFAGPQVVSLHYVKTTRSRRLITQLEAQGFRRAGVVNSPFDSIPPSTLQTYLAATTVFLVRPGTGGPQPYAGD